jgi:transcriptional regulator with XRE-family HTH domain
MGGHTMKNLDPMRDDAGVRLRRLRLQRGMPLAVLAGRCGVTASFLSMVENGRRELHRSSDIIALASALKASPLYLAFGIDAGEPVPAARPLPAPFPARPDSATLMRHQRLAGELAVYLARGDGRGAGEWLRRLAREPGISPWLLIDQFASRTASELPHACTAPMRRMPPTVARSDNALAPGSPAPVRRSPRGLPGPPQLDGDAWPHSSAPGLDLPARSASVQATRMT